VKASVEASDWAMVEASDWAMVEASDWAMVKRSGSRMAMALRRFLNSQRPQGSGADMPNEVDARIVRGPGA
jgi:hypothetical protein